MTRSGKTEIMGGVQGEAISPSLSQDSYHQGCLQREECSRWQHPPWEDEEGGRRAILSHTHTHTLSCMVMVTSGPFSALWPGHLWSVQGRKWSL